MVFLFIFVILVILVVTLKIKIEIHNVNFTIHEPEKHSICDEHKEGKKSKIFNIKDNYLVKISLKIFGFIPIFKTNITSKKVNKISKRFKKLDIKSQLKSFNKVTSLQDTKEIILNLNFKIKEFYFKSEIGLDNIILLTNIIPIFSTIISILLVKKKVKIKNQYYKILPIYNRRKFIKY